MQKLIIAGLFIIAMAYLFKIMLGYFKAKQGCASNCPKCKVDFEKINQ